MPRRKKVVKSKVKVNLREPSYQTLICKKCGQVPVRASSDAESVTCHICVVRNFIERKKQKQESVPTKKRRGRPKGSKNKTK